MFSSRIKNFDFNYILEKINSRLSWKMTLLNKVGRVTLAQSILTSMLIYTMQNLWILEGVSDKIDSTVHNFIWVNDLCHCVKWDSLTLPKSKGGLGIRSARNINISLLRNTLGIWYMTRKKCGLNFGRLITWMRTLYYTHRRWKRHLTLEIL